MWLLLLSSIVILDLFAATSATGLPAKCLLPPKTGMGRARFTRWYYNSKEGKCMTFTYGGGPGANANSFRTKEECQKECASKAKPKPKPKPKPQSGLPAKCLLPPKTGMGRAHFTAWYYNSKEGKCMSFTYGGGAGGNANNFRSKEECQKECASKAKPKPKPKPKPQSGLPAKCLLPPKTGMGRARFTRWYYSSKRGKCMTFTYGGGPGGNANSFRTKEECQKECSSKAKPKPKPKPKPQSGLPAKCLLPPKTGMGRAHFTRWYYNSKKGKCMTFTYGGGAGGNANNFRTKEECQKECASEAKPKPKPKPKPQSGLPAKCLLPPKTGMGRARFTAWYYNSKERKCMTFTYGGGAGGNANNFRTKEECQKECASKAKSSGLNHHQGNNHGTCNHHSHVHRDGFTSGHGHGHDYGHGHFKHRPHHYGYRRHRRYQLYPRDRRDRRHRRYQLYPRDRRHLRYQLYPRDRRHRRYQLYPRDRRQRRGRNPY